MLSDILESTKQSLLEHLSNPLISSFCVSWCLWNWKFLVILFSNATVSQTFHLVETVAFPDFWSCFIRGFLLPLISSAIYIFVLPYPSQFVYAFSLKRQKEANQVKQSIQDEKLLSVEESSFLREEFREYERQSKEKINALNDEIAKLKSEKVTVKPSLTKLLEPKAQSFKPSEFQLEILRFVSQAKDFVSQEKIVTAIGKTRVKTDFEIGELLKIELLKKSHDFNGETLVALTHEGRRVLLKEIDEA